MTDKNSFVLYTDTLHTVEKLSDENAGKLFKILLRYVNDQNPSVEDPLIEIAFEPIKNQLKRDLKKWENIKGKRSEAGKKGGKKSGESRTKSMVKKQNEANEANASKTKQNEANEAVSVNDSVSVIVDTNVSVYTETDFIESWKRGRLYFDKQKSDFHNLLPFERQNFNELIKKFSKQQFEFAVAGLFFQKTLPAVRVRPGWLLKPENFERMLDCWLNQNKLFENQKPKFEEKKFQKGDI